MKILLIILCFGLLSSTARAQEKPLCMFHFNNPKRDFTQQATVDVIRKYVVSKGFDCDHFIAWTADNNESITILIRNVKLEVVVETPLGKVTNPSGIKTTAELFLSIVDHMSMYFSPNLSLERPSMRYLESSLDFKEVTNSQTNSKKSSPPTAPPGKPPATSPPIQVARPTSGDRPLENAQHDPPPDETSPATNRGSAPRRPESPPPAKPGSAPR